MAETISGFQLGSFTEPQNGESPIDAEPVRANDNAIRASFNNHDAAAAIHFQGSVLGSRPAAGVAGRKWFSSDTKQIHRDNGSSWDEIDYLNLTNGGTVAGNTTFTGTLTSTSGSRTFGATTFTGTISGTAATFSGTVSAAGATLTSALSGTSASFSGTVSATGLVTASGDVSINTATVAQLRFYGAAYGLKVTQATGVMDVVSNNVAAISIANGGGVTVAGTLGATGGATFGSNLSTAAGGSVFTDDGNFAWIARRANAAPSIKLDRTGTGAASSFVTLGSGGQWSFSAGIETGGSINVTAGDIAIPNGNQFYWSSRAAIKSPADGVVTLLNNAGTGFGRLVFGPATAAFAAIKAGTTSLSFVKGDDTGLANIGDSGSNGVNFLYASVVSAGGLAVGSGTVAASGNIQMRSDATIRFRNAGNTADLNLVSVQGTDECWLGNGTTKAKMSGNVVVVGAAGQTLSFFDAAGAAQQTVTGSRGGNAALASLLTKLASYGIIVDGSSA